ncbi:histidine--tRNA ligase [Candidatus Woesebacteria bacterium CG_4_10_14_0_2_um_filter_39_14]|uniref:Histidine--tRNA ligase n=3 Tax=Microgenomates group TaxID=1794810 RepID=A0A2M6YQI9_9BACT|nr:MAG: histidine--tRNA ligase [Candidatus Shapirobacteria bacterium CG07_land_8_20_14_0_80_39_12]PIZ49679.1 MAG: histidine--tRNA ligase [Candidatus Woesebacteria bacterium CG_4_10_14_0_2_um_filter_39_14]
MEKARLQPLKGFRDFLPEQAKKREFVINTLKEVFSSYGFEPLETPALEYSSVLLKKYGKEAEKLIYQFKDRGDRDIGLRYDFTVPLARFMATNPNLSLPFKRYQIGPIWRAEKPQAGRFREIWQADIDTVGVKIVFADAEIINCALEVMKDLGFRNYSMKINDRQIFQDYGLSLKAITELDKKEKEGTEPFLKELMTEGKTEKETQGIYQKIIKTKKTKALEDLFSFLDEKRVSFDPTLARGLDYYNSIIFELRVSQYGNLSVGGGGRYDNLIGQFAERDIPATGFSFGIDRLIEAMEQQGLFKKIKTTSSQILVTVFSPEYLEKSIELSKILRQNKMRVEVYLKEDKLDKQIKYADKKGIKYVIILGPDEEKSGTVTVKNMEKGSQETIPQEKLEDYFNN